MVRGWGLHRPVASGYSMDMLVVRADGFVAPCILSRAPSRRRTKAADHLVRAVELETTNPPTSKRDP
jgi:hypothetical protein